MERKVVEKRVMNQVKLIRNELVHLKACFTVAEELKNAALKRAELMETAAIIEKEKGKDLLRHISELNEAILLSSMVSIEAEKSKTDLFSGIEAELEMAAIAVLQSQEQIKEMQQQLDCMLDLEQKLLTKTMEMEYFRLELREVKELHSLSINAAALCINDESNKLKSEAEVIGEVNQENLHCTATLEKGVRQLEQELGSTREETNALNIRVDSLFNEIHYMKDEMSKGTRREQNLEIKVAELKSKIYHGRRGTTLKAVPSHAVQELAIEAPAARIEIEELKVETKNASETISERNDPVADHVTDSTTSWIIITSDEYDKLIKKAKKADEMWSSSLEDIATNKEYQESEVDVDSIKTKEDGRKEQKGQTFDNTIDFSSGSGILDKENTIMNHEVEENAELQITEDNTVKQGDEVPDIYVDPTSFSTGITISAEEYDSLVQKAEVANRLLNLQSREEHGVPDDRKCYEVHILKEELEATRSEVNILRSSLKKALKKAELAEKAKATMEDPIRKRREKQDERRSASMSSKDKASKEWRHSFSFERQPIQEHTKATPNMLMYDEKSAKYASLARFLKMNI